MRTVANGLVLFALVVVVLGCLGAVWIPDLVGNLVVGWAFYLYRVVPQVRVSWPGVLTGGACLVLLAFGLHRFLRWLHGQRPAARPWPARWTGTVLALVVLMFAAGIAGVGIAHQTAWLVTSPEPIIGSGFREMVAATMQMNNFHQLATALHNYQENHGRLPPAAVCDKDGRPLYSWRVALLPFLEEEALYKEFKLDEPWDSPHNLRLLPRMPRFYRTPLPGLAEPDRTRYQVFMGKGTAFEGVRGLRLPDDFPDGTSNTILVVEAAEAVPWTKPADLAYDPDGPLPPLGALSREWFHAALVDGSVRKVPRKVSERTLRAAITRNGGEVLGDDWNW
jgi:hypothetical protein